MALVSGQQSMCWPVLLAGPGLCGVLLNLMPGAVNLVLAELLVGCIHTVCLSLMLQSATRLSEDMTGCFRTQWLPEDAACLYYYKLHNGHIQQSMHNSPLKGTTWLCKQ